MHLNLKPLHLFLQNIAHGHWNFPSQPPPRWPFYHLRKPLTISDISAPVVSHVADFRVAHQSDEDTPHSRDREALSLPKKSCVNCPVQPLPLRNKLFLNLTD